MAETDVHKTLRIRMTKKRCAHYYDTDSIKTSMKARQFSDQKDLDALLTFVYRIADAPEGQHVINLDGKGTHSKSCWPCQASAVLILVGRGTGVKHGF